MQNKLDYSFDDELVSKFCYDIDNKHIEVHYTGFYNSQSEDTLLDQKCALIIENWKDAKSKIGDQEKYYELNKHIGIFRMIYYMKLIDSNLEMFVNTIDNRYVTLVFIEPTINFIVIPNS